MSVNLNNYFQIKSFLDKNGIESILYGSLGVSIYLGNFKEFDDVDLLINREFLDNKWPELKKLMADDGYLVLDEKEHEFVNSEGVKIAFAGTNVLERDGICTLSTGVIEVGRESKKVRTITKEAFIKAYMFSSDDGYSKEKRGKNDLKIVKALKEL